MKDLRILFIARPYSVHAARWINQLAGCGWDLHLFPASEDALHDDFRDLTTYYIQSNASMRKNKRVRTRVLWPLPVAGHSAMRLASRMLPSKWNNRAEWLARVIRRLKPDIIHALEFQAAGYLLTETVSLMGADLPPVIVSNYGSDIYFYGPLPEHREKIKALLAAANYYTCECQRDVALAREYGFAGEVALVAPNSGGVDLDEISRHRAPGATSSRRLIAVKGYQHFAGRALVALRALELCADTLKAAELSIGVYSVINQDVRLAAEQLAARTGLRIEVIPPTTHEEILRLHGRARISVGLSISDAYSISAIEAMMMGSFPVQSNTSCLCELVQCGEGALMVPPEDPAEVAAAITRAATDDELVDRAAELNARVVERLSESVIRPQVVDMYEKVASRAREQTTRT